MSTINIGTSSTTAFKVESDTTGALLIKTGATPTLAMTIASNQNITAAGSFATSAGNITAESSSGDVIVWAKNGTVNTYMVANTTGSSKGIIGTSSNHPMSFRTNNTDYMSLSTDGKLTIVAANPSAVGLLKVQATNQDYGGSISLYYSQAANVAARAWTISPNYIANGNLDFLVSTSNSNDPSSRVVGFKENGGINNYQANDTNLSDRREKTNFSPAKNYLNVICAIPVQTFNYINDSNSPPKLGVVAQDVEAVAPELVTEDDWGTRDNPKMRLGIYQTGLQYALMKAIQELAAEVAALKGAK